MPTFIPQDGREQYEALKTANGHAHSLAASIEVLAEAFPNNARWSELAGRAKEIWKQLSASVEAIDKAIDQAITRDLSM